MKNKLQLSPKVSNKVSVKSTLVYAAAGAGIFVLLFIGAFFYFNLGTSKDSVAAVPPTTIKAVVNNGAWDNPATWSPQRVPVNGDIIEISEGIKVICNQTTINNIKIKILGILWIEKKMTLDSSSEIYIGAGGSIASNGQGNDAKLQIGPMLWNEKGNGSAGTSINEIGSPSTLSKDGETSENLLPIVLDYFQATATPTYTTLIEWGTFSEKDNDFYTLERSTDGKTFEIITTVDGADNSSKKQSYRYEDTAPVVGMNYYRLKQTDFNGDFEYFKIVGVNHKLAPNNKITPLGNISISNAWPNPFQDQINIKFDAESEGEIEILIQNSLGEIVHKAFFPFHYGKNTFTYHNAGHLRPGVYFVNFWQNGKKYEPQRLIKM